MQVPDLLGHHLAEGVEFLEKKLKVGPGRPPTLRGTSPQPAVGGSITLACSNKAQKAASGGGRVSLRHFGRNFPQDGILLGFLSIPPPSFPLGSDPGFRPHQTRQHLELPGGPMFGAIGQQGMAGDNSNRTSHRTGMQRPMMNHPQTRLVPDSPTALAGSTTQIDVLVVKKEAPIQTAHVFEAVPPNE
jgi:hypothetical protein